MGKGGKTSLEERRRKTLEVWVDNPLLSYGEIAEKSGISDSTFFRYRKDEAFMEEYKRLCNVRFQSLEAKAVHLMENQMDNGNWQAIKYCLDANGYKPEERIKAAVDNTTTINLTIGDE